jgi:Holliday junction resolvase RusA-like endonuclease
MQKFRLFVPGTPRPQGSKRYVGNGRMIEANPHHKGWRDEVITAARMAMGTQGIEKFLGPLKVELLFEMPKGSTVRRHSPETAPDVDKLTRTIFDALEQAGVVQNDAQICDVHAVKVYGTTRTGVTIELNYL